MFDTIIGLLMILFSVGVGAYIIVKGEISNECPSKYVTDDDFPTHTGKDGVTNVL